VVQGLPDTGAGTDTAALAAKAPAADTGAASESATIATHPADTGADTEAIGIGVVVSMSEAGAGADSAALVVRAADAGSGDDEPAARLSGRRIPAENHVIIVKRAYRTLASL
jgi:hypothetical protein